MWEFCMWDIKMVEAILHRFAKSKLLMVERLIRKNDLNLAILKYSQNACDLNLPSPLILIDYHFVTDKYNCFVSGFLVEKAWWFQTCSLLMHVGV